MFPNYFVRVLIIAPPDELGLRLSTAAFAAFAVSVIVLGRKTDAVAQSQPDLQATIDFMDQMVRPEERQLALVSNCEVAIVSRHKVQNWFYLSSRKGFMVGDDTSLNTEHGEPPFPRFTRFNLADVDPATVESRGSGFSDDYVKRFYDDYPACKGHDNDECDAQMLRSFEIERSDMTMASFRTADLKPAIQRGVMIKIEDPADPQYRPGYTGYGYTAKQHIDRTGLAFGDQDRAQRFVTAFIHAVSLCGGHGSMFAPTPGKKW